MTKKSQQLLAAMSFVGGDLIEEAEKKSTRHSFRAVALGITAAALALALLALPLIRNDVEQSPGGEGEYSEELPPLQQDGQKSELQINWREDTHLSADMDLRILMKIDAKVEKQDLSQLLEANGTPLQGTTAPTVIHLPNDHPYVSLMAFAEAAGLQFPNFYNSLWEQFDIESYYIRQVRSSKDDEDYSLIHDHCLELSTAGGGTATLSISRVDWPLRCYLVIDEAPLVSTVEGMELAIHGYHGLSGDLFLTCFESDGVWYDLETSDMSEEELQFLLETLLSSRDSSTVQQTEVCGYPLAPENTE